jgi:hypothetical protein
MHVKYSSKLSFPGPHHAIAKPALSTLLFTLLIVFLCAHHVLFVHLCSFALSM